MKCLAGYSERYLYALELQGTKEERQAVHDELVRRGIRHCPIMLKQSKSISKRFNSYERT